jgi:hypothetical protein
MSNKVTVTPSVMKPKDVHHVGIEKSFERIRDGKSRKSVEEIRNFQILMDKCDQSTEQGKQDYKELKKHKDSIKRSLPSWSYSGVFEGRKNANCQESSGLMVLDFDGIDVTYAKNELKNRDYIFATWESPSGNGVKALAKIKPSVKDEDYKAVYKQIEYDLKYLNIDEACKDISRACFESYDPEIYINDNPKEFELTQIDVMEGIRGMIFKSGEGKLHDRRLAAGNYAGGLIAEGLISEEEALAELKKAVIEHGTADPEMAMKDLKDGIKNGMGRPLPKDMIPTVEAPKETILDKYPALSFVSNMQDDLNFIHKLRRGEVEIGKPTGYKDLDEYFRFKEGKFNVIMGRANVGKSYIVWFLMALSNRLHGWKWIVFSGENESFSVRQELVKFISGQQVDKLSDWELEKVMELVDENFKIIKVNDLITAEDLLTLAEELMKTGEYKGIMIDPYNHLKIPAKYSTQPYNYHYETISKFKQWSGEKNCTIFLNTHVGTVGARKVHQDGDYKGHPTVPEKFDIENGVMFDNKADDFIVVHRYVQMQGREYITEIHVKKVKETWSGGKPTPLESPVYLELANKNGFGSFYDSYGVSPLQEKYMDWKIGLQKQL